jgi:hypothetical protein
MPRPHKLLVRYSLLSLASVGAIAGVCFAINMLVDPLWYFGGNIITGVNYIFDERLAKMNRGFPRLRDYDCLILGSSTAALLPEKAIEGHRCYNLGFSGGVISEFLLYGKYLRAHGFKPALLIVGVDEFNFEGPAAPPDVPDFVLHGDDPPSFLLTYLSLDSLDFSIRTLRGDYPHHRLYDSEFRSHIIPRGGTYSPPMPLAEQAKPPEFHPERSELYTQLRQMFPEARAIGFVAPTAAWTIAQLELDGRLEAYLNALYRVSQSFDEFLDFGIPSQITVSKTDTYDGLHYKDAVNDHTIHALISGIADPGVDWIRESPASIAAAYRERIDTLVLRPKNRTD